MESCGFSGRLLSIVDKQIAECYLYIVALSNLRDHLILFDSSPGPRRFVVGVLIHRNEKNVDLGSDLIYIV